jgi:hypothetical protein
MDGANLSDVLDGKPPGQKLQERPLFFQWHRGNRPEPFRNAAVRQGKWKLVEGKALFDLDSDPAETTDLAEREPEATRRLRSAYERWFRDVTKPGFEPVRIVIGSGRESPVLLTRQDWRIETENPAPDTIGIWEVEAVRRFRAKVRVWYSAVPETGIARVRIGGIEVAQPVASGSAQCLFDGLEVAKGRCRIEAWVEAGGKRAGATHVEVRL